MPWTCPVCDLSIQHSEEEATPRRGLVYRCHICRLELVVDSDRDKMIVVRFDQTQTASHATRNEIKQ